MKTIMETIGEEVDALVLQGDGFLAFVLVCLLFFTLIGCPVIGFFVWLNAQFFTKPTSKD